MATPPHSIEACVFRCLGECQGPSCALLASSLCEASIAPKPPFVLKAVRGEDRKERFSALETLVLVEFSPFHWRDAEVPWEIGKACYFFAVVGLLEPWGRVGTVTPYELSLVRVHQVVFGLIDGVWVVPHLLDNAQALLLGLSVWEGGDGVLKNIPEPVESEGSRAAPFVAFLQVPEQVCHHAPKWIPIASFGWRTVVFDWCW